MLDCGAIELAVIRREFSHLIARWRLTQSEVRDLLGEEQEHLVAECIVPGVLGRDAETRVRLLLRLDAALECLAEGAEVAGVVRSNRFAGGTSLLSTLSSLPDLRAAVRLAEKGPAYEQFAGSGFT